MNERMIELYREASEFAYKICRDEGREGGTGDHMWNMLSTGKFAELIVRECAERLLHDVKLTDIQTTRCVASIQEHFGVDK